MGLIGAKALMLLATLLIVTTNTSNSFAFNGTEIAQIRIIGRVTCQVPPPPAPPGSQPILNGINVVLSCNGQTTTLAQALTDASGTYELVLTALDSALFDPNTCFAVVRLPIAACIAFPPTGNLRALLSVIGIVQPLLGAVAIVAAGPLGLVT